MFPIDIWYEILSHLIVPYVYFSSIATFSRLSKQHYKIVRDSCIFQSILQIKYKDDQMVIGRYDQIKQMVSTTNNNGKIGQTFNLPINAKYMVKTHLDFIYPNGMIQIDIPCHEEMMWSSNIVDRILHRVVIKDTLGWCWYDVETHYIMPSGHLNLSRVKSRHFIHISLLVGLNPDWTTFGNRMYVEFYFSFDPRELVIGYEVGKQQLNDICITFYPDEKKK